jgi:hypothetical protein
MSSDESATVGLIYQPLEWMTLQALPNGCDVFQPGKQRTQFAMWRIAGPRACSNEPFNEIKN